MNYSIVIPTYNEGQNIYQCLSSLGWQFTAQDEIIVVDGYSTDNTQTEIARYNQTRIQNTPEVKLLLENEKKGCSMARNIGVKAAKNEILIFCDADMVAARNFYAVIDHDFTRIPELAALSGIIMPHPAHAYPHDWILFMFMVPFWNMIGGNGNNMCMRKAVFEQLGGFRQVFRDDLELWQRLERDTDYLHVIDPNLISYISLRRIRADGPFPIGYINFLTGEWLRRGYPAIREQSNCESPH